MAHSPAPWTWGTGSHICDRPMLLDSKGCQIMHFGSMDMNDEISGTPPEPPDAALICAAPDLLEASNELLLHLQRLSITHPHLVDDAMCLRARTAIAKATNPIQDNQSDADILSRQIVAEEYHCGKCGRLLTNGESHNCTNPIQTT